jgi:hypothetical protein
MLTKEIRVNDITHSLSLCLIPSSRLRYEEPIWDEEPVLDEGPVWYEEPVWDEELV